jgi:GTP diphosphokinase / guanosine-3',5'-bis(diphosphate) 3'-diphosphatase
VFLFTDLRDQLAEYLSQDEVAEITQAYLLAEQAHEGQLRQTGEPYITHPVEVARILAHMRMDYESIMAAMLHDVLEDTLVDKPTLVERFGEAVADLVDGVSKLEQIKFESRAEAQAENFRKMIMAMVRDIRVILVKLADRLHNMRTLGALAPAKRRRIARETLEIYAPIANRLGMHNFRVEFEELGFAAYYPLRYRILKDAVRKARGNRKEIISTIEAGLKEAAVKSSLPPDAISGREKHLYSIYKKMRTKRIPFNEIMDVYAFRIVVDSIDMCYRVLGLVHNLYKPVPGRFKDYIAIPKANGYQSLHTTLFGPYGVPIEIQIRTQEMHHMAENGIAAHWLYKSPSVGISMAQTYARAWLKGLLEMQKNTGNSLEFIENVKIDLFPDEVYVFTPKGDILKLPSGATAVDFAYAVHTDVGNSCVAVKLERRLVPLSTPLANGNTVEVITAPGAKPNPAWLSFVVTGKARSNIRHFLKSQRRAESVALGARLLETALNQHALSLASLPKKNLQIVLKEAHIKTADDLFEQLGLGNRQATFIAERLAVIEGCLETTPSETVAQALVIQGTEGMAVHFANCCWPIPGDVIVGVLAAGQGLTIHQSGCPVVLARRQTDNTIAVCWEDTVQGEFQVELRVEVVNQRGMLASIATAIADAGANIETIRSEDKDGRYTIVTLLLSVQNRAHLARVMRKVRTFKAVSRITRSRR